MRVSGLTILILGFAMFASGCANSLGASAPKAPRGAYDFQQADYTGSDGLAVDESEYLCDQAHSAEPSTNHSDSAAFTICQGKEDSKRLLVKTGDDDFSDEVYCVFPTQHTQGSIDPAMTDSQDLAEGKCVAVSDGKVEVAFDDEVVFNSVFIVTEDYRNEMTVWLSNADALFPPFWFASLTEDAGDDESSEE